MNQTEQFLQLINQCSNIVEKYQGHSIYSLRYEKMLNSLTRMQVGLKQGKQISRTMITLPIMDMLEQNDPEDMIESVKAVFAFYRDNYQLPW
jgi:hypothetical protein